ncbi:hypothetical protein BGZ96_003257 [Linnemannia gamsii]|uniref:Uncharacterized protein n=1 Tax=Linnemannia gamsii TaxID=64522 RepID=A0ABQ7JJF6_9FUNG|nr:hypothetical protein BGZ96_003257 [Linnemannia gamsii]
MSPLGIAPAPGTTDAAAMVITDQFDDDEVNTKKILSALSYACVLYASHFTSNDPVSPVFKSPACPVDSQRDIFTAHLPSTAAPSDIRYRLSVLFRSEF